MSYSIQHRTPICVSVLPKLSPMGKGCSQNASFVPKTGAEKIDDQDVDPTPPAVTACPLVRVDSNNYYDWSFGAENMRPKELKECFNDGVNLNNNEDDLGRANNEKELITNRKTLQISIHE
ncbi:hypothetical protein TorRG33x02_220990 [Trema orientale]|uniref:Uncharacterized protein n=1 Tax=Trema orientale TaxID=63057 RepID=A0A2P5E9B5_TREOI|nr:hypothetical protein TorRG33x02_220990 [Trema orientale]